MELWESGKTRREAIEFAAGWDAKQKPIYDNLLISYQLKLEAVFSNELLRQKYIDKSQFKAIQKGLKELDIRYKVGKLTVEGHEDVHSMVESELAKKYGDLVGNIHLGLSRNDQICSVMRMWMKESAKRIGTELYHLVRVLENEIVKKGKTKIPGYTHHRIAMPTNYGTLLGSYITQLNRDKQRLDEWACMYDKCPLGSGAGFGTSIRIDRIKIARELGFAGPTENTIDVVTTRWEAEASLAFALSVTLNHLSTISQDLIYLSSAGIDVLSLPKEYCTGSSLMPQKLNPDVLEVIKAKAAVAQGSVCSILSIGKGNISGYNRDAQWTKYLLMDLVAEFGGLVEVLSGMFTGIKIDETRSEELLKIGGAYAAEEAIKKAIREGKSFRKVKLDVERKIKKNR